jgi:hypothetical protein
MNKGKIKLPEKCEVQGSYALDEFEKFLNQHFAEGHDVRLFLDPNGNSYAIFCAACDPRMGDVMETKH